MNKSAVKKKIICWKKPFDTACHRQPAPYDCLQIIVAIASLIFLANENPTTILRK